jgi:type IV secretion system protein VirB1
MDPTAFIALAERCAPSAEPRLLAGLVQRASGYEPLAFQFDNGPRGPMKLLGSSKAEAIQLASELVIAGHRVRVGLAGIDARDLDKLGVSIADAFDPCRNLNAAVRLITESRAQLKPSSAPARVAARDNAKPASIAVPAPRPGSSPTLPARAWDVYGQGRLSSTLVYSARE